ncbi:MAG: CHASE2 domain-containing protein [Armatimonadetes bacterium]|nr:CHASE2 domain-containing protein [Armatimonadota bacterium]
MRLPKPRGLLRIENRTSRAVFWIATGALVFLVVLAALSGIRPAAWAAFGLWLFANVLLSSIGIVWGALHPRCLILVAPTAWRWSFWTALANCLWAPGMLDRALAESYQTSMSAGLSALVSLFAFVFLLPLGIFLTYTAASVGAMVVGNHPDQRQEAVRAAHAAWSWAWLGILTLLALAYMPVAAAYNAIAAAMIIGSPVLAVATNAMLRAKGLTAGDVLRGWSRKLSQKLTVQRRSGRRLDLRGAALGLIAGMASLLIASAYALNPLQAWALLWAVQFRNAPLISERPNNTLYASIDPKAVESQDQIVLVEWDDESRRRAVSDSSISKLMAEAVDKLKAAKRVILFAPLVDPNAQTSEPVVVPGPESIKRAERDMPLVADAMKRAKNVLLGLPGKDLPATGSRYVGPLDSGYLIFAASAIGTSDLTAFKSGRLPAIEVNPPVGARSIALVAADRSSVDGREISRGRALIDFASPRPGSGFRRISLSTVLSGHDLALHAREAGSFSLALGDESSMEAKPGMATWVKPEEFFKEKIVFLTPIYTHLRETPIGMMSDAETLAHATSTALADRFISTPAGWQTIAIVLLAGMIVGVLCQNRDPLLASWRSLAVVFLAATLTIFMFLFQRTWIDPVAPAVAALISYFAVTQFTFGLRRSDLERNRGLLQRFVAPQVIDELLDDPESNLGLGGTRRQICVLFADIRNFTPFAEQVSPEEVVRITNLYMTALTDALHQHGGLLDKYTGDGLMALFRVENDPKVTVQSAVAAALAMHKAALVCAERMRAEKLEPLEIGIGLHYGEAVVGLIGNPNQFNYTALGHTVVVSHRLQTLARGGDTVLSEETYLLINDQFSAEADEPVQIKGLSQSVRPYRISQKPALLP